MPDTPIDPDAQAGMVQALLAELDLYAPEHQAKAAALLGGAIALLAAKDGKAGLDGALRIVCAGISEAAKTLGMDEDCGPVGMMAVAIDAMRVRHGDMPGVSAANIAFAKLVSQHVLQISGQTRQ